VGAVARLQDLLGRGDPASTRAVRGRSWHHRHPPPPDPRPPLVTRSRHVPAGHVDIHWRRSRWPAADGHGLLALEHLLAMQLAPAGPAATLTTSRCCWMNSSDAARIFRIVHW